MRTRVFPPPPMHALKLFFFNSYSYTEQNNLFLFFYRKFLNLDLYILKKLDVKKFARTFPTELNELTDFLVAITKDSECAEMKACVENFVKGGNTEESISSKLELDVDVNTEDVQDSDGEDCKDVANQTEETESGK